MQRSQVAEWLAELKRLDSAIGEVAENVPVPPMPKIAIADGAWPAHHARQHAARRAPTIDAAARKRLAKDVGAAVAKMPASYTPTAQCRPTSAKAAAPAAAAPAPSKPTARTDKVAKAPAPAPAAAKPAPAQASAPRPRVNALERSHLRDTGSARHFAAPSSPRAGPKDAAPPEGAHAALHWHYNFAGACVGASHSTDPASQLVPHPPTVAGGRWRARVISLDTAGSAASGAGSRARLSSDENEYGDDYGLDAADDYELGGATSADDRLQQVDLRLPGLAIDSETGALSGVPDVRALLRPGMSATGAIGLTWTGPPPPARAGGRAAAMSGEMRVGLALARDASIDGAHLLLGAAIGRARRPLLVLDTSGSMARDGRLRVLQSTLLRLCERLEAQQDAPLLPWLTHFNLLAFSGDVRRFAPSMREADAKTARDAARWVRGLKPKDETHTWAALDAARAAGAAGRGSRPGARADVAVLISDGAPSEPAPFARSRAAVTSLVSELGCTVSTIAYECGPDADGVAFLKDAASLTGGVHARADFEALTALADAEE